MFNSRLPEMSFYFRRSYDQIVGNCFEDPLSQEVPTAHVDIYFDQKSHYQLFSNTPCLVLHQKAFKNSPDGLLSSWNGISDFNHHFILQIFSHCPLSCSWSAFYTNLSYYADFAYSQTKKHYRKYLHRGAYNLRLKVQIAASIVSK